MTSKSKLITDTCWYLSPTTTVFNEDGRFKDCFGLLETLRSFRRIEPRFPVWALDNGCFSNAWTEKAWKRMLEFYTDTEKERCLFACVPDVVYDAKGTLEWFKLYSNHVRDMGYPVALVTQDGMQTTNIPWDEIDCIFIGGSDWHKRGAEGGRLMAAGVEHGKWVHIGRVNSGLVMLQRFLIADSWDGLTLARSPGQQYGSIGRAIREIRNQKSGNQMSLFGRKNE